MKIKGRSGGWLSYTPWCFNRYTRAQYPGRTTKKHRVTNEDDAAVTFACGKTVDKVDMFDIIRTRPPADDDGAWQLRQYCKRCLKTVDIERGTNPRRDHQRKRVYRSEWAISAYGEGFVADDVDEAQEYVDLLMASPFVHDTFGRVDRNNHSDRPIPVRVRARKGYQNRGHANASEIALGAATLTEYTILHELAHTLHRRLRSRHRDWGDHDTNDLDHSGHGSVWCAIFLALLDEFMDADIARRLRAQFDKKGVKWDEWEEVRP